MVLVPADHDDIELLSRVKELLAPAGFGRFSITTAEQHDEMIAFTSQLAHVVSNAYIKSPTAGTAQGLLRRQLQGYDPCSVAGPRKCGRSCFWKTRTFSWRSWTP